MHWDVARLKRLATAHEVWKVDSPAGYLNVYPDGKVRATSASHARRVWPSRK